ncbi:MAG TPA: ATP-binding protein [Candidatus Mcinerneyibacteriales bacterium]|nr:ATP-binding protein [Candidatus Mcinerneyibacteriales bacterium]
MIRSIFLKIILSFIAIILLLALPLSLFSSRTIEKHLTAVLKRDMEKIVRTILPLAADLGDTPLLDREIDSMGEAIRTRITIIGRDGRVWADSTNDPETLENHKNRIEIRQALLKGTGFSVRYSDTEEKKMLYVALPFPAGTLGEEARGVVRASLYLEDITLLNRALFRSLIRLLALLIALALLLAFFLSRSLSAPVRAIAAASMDVSRGRFDAKVHLKNHDELKTLADNFNVMTEKLSDLFRQAREDKEKITNIIESLSEALFVIDAQGIITLCNSSFLRLTGASRAAGRSLHEVIVWPELISLIETSRQDRKTRTEEITLEKKSWLASMSPISSGGGIILLHDISLIRKTEKMKKDLVANVSHELRTPLTAIKGFADTLLESAQDSEKKYLEIIAAHTDRLISIVGDLSELARLEEKREPAFESVNLSEVVEDVTLLFEKKAREKSLRLFKELPHEPLVITGDKLKLEQLLINLMENALRYTDKGHITVAAGREGPHIFLTVSDTGIGIPRGKQERIFERFYVVDKSRSRRTGGTGLGLSIVKHIALIHGAEVKVRSEEKTGSSFTILFPSV